jgi:hypothetical protein
MKVFIPWIWIMAFGVATANQPAQRAVLENESVVVESGEETDAQQGDAAAHEMPASPAAEQPIDPYQAVPEELLDDYFGGRPAAFLIDPQRLLSPADFRERQGFLEYHASDSAIDLYVCIFAGDQRISGEGRVGEWLARHFANGRPAVAVAYFLGEPQRAMIELSPALAEIVPLAERRRALESSIMQAVKEVESARQIEAFLVQMSIRLYWMEGLLGHEKAVPPTATPHAAGVKKAPKPSRWMQLAGPWLLQTKPYLIPVGALAGSLLASMGVVVLLRWRARYHFPDFEVEPRLGGAHAAGVGAVISFANTNLPPASQRDQMPDYLRRA